jgi:hypothetical protein
MDEAAFEYTGKRPGQEGLLLKTIVRLQTGWEFSNSAVFAMKDYENRNVQLLSELRRRCTSALSVQVDCLLRQRTRGGPPDYGGTSDRKIRLEARFHSGDLMVRGYIAHGHGRGEKDYVSIFGSVKGRLSAAMNIEVWSHWSRIRNGRVERWHMFVRLRQEVLDRLWFTTRFTNTYQKAVEGINRPYVWFEVEATL